MKATLYNGAEGGDWSLARGLHYGDGVFRTLLICDGRVLDLDRQLQHLAGDAMRLGLEPPAAAILAGEAVRLALGQGRAVLKILLWRRTSMRGYAPTESACERLLILSAAPTYPARCWEQGIVACRSPVILGRQPRLAGIKHLNRLEQVLASRDWPTGSDEALLADEAGQLVGGSRSNLFWIEDATLCTPVLDGAGIAGHQRARILGLAREAGIPLAETRASWDTLRRADEAFVCNSLIGLWPLHRLDDHCWPETRPLTRRLQTLLDHPRLS